MLHILFALFAGVLTVAAPCILPLLPVLLGTALGHQSKTRPLFIVLGFVVTFTVAGLLLSLLANRLGLNPNTIRTTGIVVLALFGIFLIWNAPFERLMGKFSVLFTRVSAAGTARQGNLGGFILGLTLGLVWTPCAGPVLGSILTLVALQRELATAGILLLAYAVGAGVPMLAIAYGGQYLSSRVKVLEKYTRGLQLVFGVLILLLAVALYFNYDTKLYALFLQYCPVYNPQLFL